MQQSDYEKLLAETLAAHGRSPPEPATGVPSPPPLHRACGGALLRRVGLDRHLKAIFGSNPLRCPACKTGVLVATRVLPPLRA